VISVKRSDTRIDSFFTALKRGQDSEASQRACWSSIADAVNARDYLKT